MIQYARMISDIISFRVSTFFVDPRKRQHTAAAGQQQCIMCHSKFSLFIRYTPRKNENNTYWHQVLRTYHGTRYTLRKFSMSLLACVCCACRMHSICVFFTFNLSPPVHIQQTQKYDRTTARDGTALLCLLPFFLHLQHLT